VRSARADHPESLDEKFTRPARFYASRPVSYRYPFGLAFLTPLRGPLMDGYLHTRTESAVEGGGGGGGDGGGL